MNPITNTRNITKMNEKELELGVPENASWHQMYKNSSWIFFGGVDSDLTEGDLICVFSQWGEVVNIHLVRDRTTGKSKGYGFLAYYNQKSTILAVDNANGIKLCGRILRVDHCENYKLPKNLDKLDPETRDLIEKGCAPEPICIKKADDNRKDDGQNKKKDEVDIKKEIQVKKKSKERGDDQDDKESERNDKRMKDENNGEKEYKRKKEERRETEMKSIDSRYREKNEDYKRDEFRKREERKETEMKSIDSRYKEKNENYKRDEFRRNDFRENGHRRGDYRKEDYRRR